MSALGAILEGLASVTHPMLDDGATDRLVVIIDLVTPLASVVVDSEVMHDPVDPREKAGAALKAREVGPGANERLPDQLFGSISIVRKLQRHGEHPPLVTLHKLLKSCVISL